MFFPSPFAFAAVQFIQIVLASLLHLRGSQGTGCLCRAGSALGLHLSPDLLLALSPGRGLTREVPPFGAHSPASPPQAPTSHPVPPPAFPRPSSLGAPLPVAPGPTCPGIFMRAPWAPSTIPCGSCLGRGDLLRMLVVATVARAGMEMWACGPLMWQCPASPRLLPSPG